MRKTFIWTITAAIIASVTATLLLKLFGIDAAAAIGGGVGGGVAGAVASTMGQQSKNDAADD